MPPTGPLLDGKPTTGAIAQDLVDFSDLTFITNRPWTVFLSVNAAKKIKNTQARMRTDDALASNADGEEISDIVGSNIRDEVRLATLATQSSVNE